MNSIVKTLLTVAIGYITFFGAVFFSVRSEANVQAANVKAPGTFIPVACGEAKAPATAVQDVPQVTAVCMGRIEGEPAKNQMGAFEFRDEAGVPVVYRVTEVSNLLVKILSGATRSQVFMVGPQGDQISMKINRQADGSFTQALGQIGDARFFVPEFEPVFTTL